MSMEEDREGLEEKRREKDGWETGMQWRRVKTDGTKTSRGMRREPCHMWRTFINNVILPVRRRQAGTGYIKKILRYFSDYGYM